MALAVASIFDAMIRLRPDATATLARLADAVTLGELGPGAFVGIIRRELGPTALLQALLLLHGVPEGGMDMAMLKRHLTGCTLGMACPMPACRAAAIMKAKIADHCVGCSLDKETCVTCERWATPTSKTCMPVVAAQPAMMSIASLQLAATKISTALPLDASPEGRSETPLAARTIPATPAGANKKRVVQALPVRAVAAAPEALPPMDAAAQNAADVLALVGGNVSSSNAANAAHSLLFLARTVSGVSRGVFAELNIDRRGASPYNSPTGSPMGTPPQIRKRTKMNPPAEQPAGRPLLAWSVPARAGA